jgi:pilus assembly protein TadC
MAAADQERRREGAAARVAAARLGVQVVLPTGLCLLPAFVLLAVVPLVLALLGVG